MLDASVVFLIIISALATIIWIKGNIGDKVGGIVIDQNKEKSDLASMERKVSKVTEHVRSVFERGRKEAGSAKKDKDENGGESRDGSGKKSADTGQGSSGERKKRGSRGKKSRQK